MPGLINKENRSALPLSVSDITSCVRGYTLALTASMTYENIEDHAIEGKWPICLLKLHDHSKQIESSEKHGCKIHFNSWKSIVCCTWFICICFSFLSCYFLGIFIYPLEENSIVAGFEAMISSQIITLQIKDKAKIDDCYLDCCNTSNGALQSGSGKIKAAPINIFILAMDQKAMCNV